MSAVSAVVRWYLNLYHRTPDDPGVLSMFEDHDKVGAFAVSVADLRNDEADALFRLLVAITMFQRRQDVQIMRVLRGISAKDVGELTRPRRLLKLVDESPCEHMRTAESLHGKCDLAKHAITRKGRCGANPKVLCHMKHHTVLLRRYGHFGKVPTSAALMLREAGVGTLGGLRRKVMTSNQDPVERAHLLEEHLSRAWRVSNKIAAMFLSALCVPDLNGEEPVWGGGIDWGYFVVVDSNVDMFLKAIAYRGAWSYEARRAFIRSISERIDLAVLRRGLARSNPRLVQQAMYIFMSTTNRRANPRDCMHLGPATCRRCPTLVARLCPVRRLSTA